jgi:uncharacterized protein (DUF433 family)
MNQTEARPSWIQKRPGVCGGDACLRDTRHAVWGLVDWRHLGLSDEQILQRHPDLTPADLTAAWEYYQKNHNEIEQALWFNRVDATDRSRESVAAAVAEGRRLGLKDQDIQEAFEPPLSPADLFPSIPARESNGPPLRG